MVATIFGGISFTGQEASLCESMTTAARRWPFAKVKASVSGRGWRGESLPDNSPSLWIDDLRSLAIGKQHSREGSCETAVFIDLDAGEVRLSSGTGLLPLFYAFEDGNLIFASDPTLVCAALGSRPRLDHLGLTALFALQYLTPARTLFDGVKRLPPFHSVEGDHRGWPPPGSLVQSFIDSAPQPGSIDIGQAVDCFKKAVADAVSDSDGVCLPLTGGVDSRTILAVVASNRSVRSYTRGEGRDAEVVIAEKLAKVAGVPHQFFPFPNGYIEKFFPRISHLTGGCVSVENGHAIYPLTQLVEQGRRLVLPGTNGEFGRSYWSLDRFSDVKGEAQFWNRFFDLNIKFSPDRIKSVLLPPWGEAVDEGLQRLRQEYQSDISPSGIAPQVDLDWIYLLRRVPLFMAWGPYIWGSALRVEMPFMNPRYLRAVAGLSATKRLGPSVHISVMEECDSKLLRIPLVPSGRKLKPGAGEKWRARLRRKTASLTGVVQGSPQRYDVWLRQERNFVESILFSDAAQTRGVFRLTEVRKILDRHLDGGDETAMLCRLLTIEMACLINQDRMPVSWSEN